MVLWSFLRVLGDCLKGEVRGFVFQIYFLDLRGERRQLVKIEVFYCRLLRWFLFRERSFSILFCFFGEFRLGWFCYYLFLFLGVFQGFFFFLKDGFFIVRSCVCMIFIFFWFLFVFKQFIQMNRNSVRERKRRNEKIFFMVSEGLIFFYI